MALVVVRHTSPIRALHHLGLLALCEQLFGGVTVPEAVQEELRRPTMTCPAVDITSRPGFAVRAPQSMPEALGVPPDLDAGETQAITLAIELKADLLLMDERKGTEAAKSLGLATIGVFGVLLEANRKHLIGPMLPLVDRLMVELKFYVSPTLRLRLAQLANE